MKVFGESESTTFNFHSSSSKKSFVFPAVLLKTVTQTTFEKVSVLTDNRFYCRLTFEGKTVDEFCQDLINKYESEKNSCGENCTCTSFLSHFQFDIFCSAESEADKWLAVLSALCLHLKDENKFHEFFPLPWLKQKLNHKKFASSFGFEQVCLFQTRTNSSGELSRSES